MKPLLSILLALCCFSGMGQTKKRYKGPDTVRITQPNGEYVELVSSDTAHYRVYPDTTAPEPENDDRYYRRLRYFDTTRIGRGIYNGLLPKPSRYASYSGINMTQGKGGSIFSQVDKSKYDTLIDSHVTDTLQLDFLLGNPKEDDNREYQTDNRGIVFHPALFEDKPKYDTIGGWHLVAASDTIRGRFVQVGLCYIYEVRKYYNDWIMVTDGRTEWSSGQKEMFESPHHHAWLDSNKRPLKHYVIQ